MNAVCAMCSNEKNQGKRPGSKHTTKDLRNHDEAKMLYKSYKILNECGEWIEYK